MFQYYSTHGTFKAKRKGKLVISAANIKWVMMGPNIFWIWLLHELWENGFTGGVELKGKLSLSLLMPLYFMMGMKPLEVHQIVIGASCTTDCLACHSTRP